MRRGSFPWAEVLKLRGIVITTRTECHSLEAANATEEPKSTPCMLACKSTTMQLNNQAKLVSAHRPNRKISKVIGVVTLRQDDVTRALPSWSSEISNSATLEGWDTQGTGGRLPDPTGWFLMFDWFAWNLPGYRGSPLHSFTRPCIK